MTASAYPLDAVGNELCKGDLVRVTLQSPALNFRITAIEPASVIGPPGGTMSVRGTLMLVATMPVDFDAGAQLTGMFKLCDPTPEAADVVRRTDMKLVTQ
jgi:hypothetical protein